MNLLELFLGQIPEAVFFAIFMILVKNIKSKRSIFIILMIVEYVMLLNVFPYSTWSHILYFMLSFAIMKLLYEKKCNITDIFTLGIASIVLLLSSVVMYFTVYLLSHSILAYAICNRIFIFGLLYLCRNLLPKINAIYFKFWDRNDKIKKCMKSATFRVLNLIIFNFSIVIIHIIMLYAVVLHK